MKSNLKTMKSRPEVTDQEIQQFMNFDKLLSEKEKLLEHRKKIRTIRNSLIGAVVLTVAVTVFFMLTHKTEKPQTNNTSVSESVELPKELKGESEPLKSKTTESPQTPKKNSPANNVVRNNKKSTTEETSALPEAEAEHKENVYVQAEPINGYPALYEFFNRELKYPPAAVKDSIEGIVTVIFTIDVDGKAQNVQIENSLGNAFDEQVYAVFEKMPAWKPASYNDKAVPSKISLPLTFEINKFNANN
jgi:TonB family protein